MFTEIDKQLLKIYLENTVNRSDSLFLLVKSYTKSS